MNLKDFLSMVKDGLDLASLDEADRVVRVVVGALKLALPEGNEEVIASVLPTELSAGWEEVAPMPEETLERLDIYLEEGDESRVEREETPSITDG